MVCVNLVTMKVVDQNDEIMKLVKYVPAGINDKKRNNKE